MKGERRGALIPREQCKPATDAGREWALASRQVRRSCETCRWASTAPKGKACLDFIAGAAEARKEGKSDASLAALTDEVCERFGFPMTLSSVKRHVEKCLSVRWGRLALRR